MNDDMGLYTLNADKFTVHSAGLLYTSFTHMQVTRLLATVLGHLDTQRGTLYDFKNININRFIDI